MPTQKAWTHLGETERAILHAVNDTAAAFAEFDLYERLVANASRLGDAPAIIGDTHVMSHADLLDAVELARRGLVQMGVRPGQRVAVCGANTPEQVVVLLAVLAAGAAYVPLDPAAPAGLLGSMLEETAATLIVSDGTECEGLPAVTFAQLTSATASASTARVSSGAGSPLFATIYTSGSTGRPKGVDILWAGIANRVQWMQHAFGLTERDRVLFKTPATFDVSIWELLWPLLAGAVMIAAGPSARRSATTLAQLCERHEVTVLHCVPSMLRQLLRVAREEDLAAVRLIVASGEVLGPSLVDGVAALAPKARLANLYGPTEASIDVSYWLCSPGEDPVPLGTPIANTQLHVVDEAMAEMPFGKVGELVIGGVGLAQGYCGRPDLTAERFIDDPHGVRGRLYRTGDLARRRSDGVLEYVGRTDSEVKLHGIRMNLVAIEEAIRATCDVGDVLVDCFEAGSGNKYLCAFVAAPGPGESATRIRSRLSHVLHRHMIPRHIRFLETLPRTSSGKVARGVLSPSVPTRPEWLGEFVPPSFELEHRLTDLFSTVLGIDEVGAEDDLFELGGDSMSAVELGVQLVQEFGDTAITTDPPLEVLLLQFSTPSSLAAHLRSIGCDENGTP